MNPFISREASRRRRKAFNYPPIFAYGFRPFFLLAGIHATLALPLWLAFLHGFDPLHLPLAPHSWHAHELIFGFIVAAVAGFLLTAVPSWTGRRGFAGAPLIGLALLWLAGRVVTTFPLGLSAPTIAVIDLAFVPLLAFTILPTLIRSGNRRNSVFIGLLAILFASNLYFHLDSANATGPLQSAINLMLIMVTMVSGRVIPAFTSAGLKQRGMDIRIRRYPLLDRAVLIAVSAVFIVDLVSPDSLIAALLAAVTATLLALQLARWQGQHSLRVPIIWILHLGYAWLPLALALKVAWLSGMPIPATSWLHALTTGAFATMILAVMSRAALGHTGRALSAAPAIVIAYLLLSAAAFTRVFAPILNPDAWSLWMGVAAALWSTAFMLFVITYAPILCRPRVDGRAG